MDHRFVYVAVITAGREALRVLTHSRQYPDGSTVVVAVNATKIYEAEESDLLFGWFVAPCSLHDGLGSVNVSCIVAQPFENQATQDQNLSVNLMLRLRQCLPPQQYQVPPQAPPGFTASRPRNRSVYSDGNSNQRRLSYQDLVPAAPAPPMPMPAMQAQGRRDYHSHYQPQRMNDDHRSFDNQRSHEANASFLGVSRTISEESFTSSEASSCVKIVPVQQQLQSQVSNLNQNERMMLDLLDKTISTQEILAAQQHEMASVIDYHGSQLQRISTAIERVENLLADSGERLKRLPQSKTNAANLRRSVC